MAEINDVVRVRWTDTIGSSGWRDRDDAKDLKPASIETYGRLERDEETFITVSSNVDITNDKVDHTMTIPKTAVHDITVLRKAK